MARFALKRDHLHQWPLVEALAGLSRTLEVTARCSGTWQHRHGVSTMEKLITAEPQCAMHVTVTVCSAERW